MEIEVVGAKALACQYAERMGEEYKLHSMKDNWRQVALIYKSFMVKLSDYDFRDRVFLFELFNRHATFVL